jgi:cell division protease FtsH
MVFDKITHERPYSDATAKLIDDEVKDLIQEASRRAEAIISDPHNRKILDNLADALLEKETLDEDDVNEILKDAILPKPAMLHAA